VACGGQIVGPTALHCYLLALRAVSSGNGHRNFAEISMIFVHHLFRILVIAHHIETWHFIGPINMIYHFQWSLFVICSAFPTHHLVCLIEIFPMSYSKVMLS